MRIQHNIPAMSAYRNYSNNVSSVSKNLERLSSGYRINRAGDDAAGLAISEKMRAQISGLEQAQTNAKSGINLVQTAEGALTEVHDMLNRMYTLAEQSANGTYDNSVDRVQLQKEVNQLRTEINRIADSANFNGIKLLDGSMDPSPLTVNDVTITPVRDGDQNIIDEAKGVYSFDLKDFKVNLDAADGAGGAGSTASLGSAVKGSASKTVVIASQTGDSTKINGANALSAAGTMAVGSLSVDLSKITNAAGDAYTALASSVKAAIDAEAKKHNDAGAAGTADYNAYGSVAVTVDKTGIKVTYTATPTRPSDTQFTAGATASVSASKAVAIASQAGDNTKINAANALSGAGTMAVGDLSVDLTKITNAAGDAYTALASSVKAAIDAEAKKHNDAGAAGTAAYTAYSSIAVTVDKTGIKVTCKTTEMTPGKKTTFTAGATAACSVAATNAIATDSGKIKNANTLSTWATLAVGDLSVDISKVTNAANDSFDSLASSVKTAIAAEAKKHNDAGAAGSTAYTAYSDFVVTAASDGIKVTYKTTEMEPKATAGVSVTVGGKALTFKPNILASSGIVTGLDVAAAIDTDQVVSIAGINYNVSVNGTKVTLTAQKAPSSDQEIPQGGDLKVEVTGVGNHSWDQAVHMDTPAAVAGGQKVAQASFLLNNNIVKDGGQLTIGNTTYTFRVGRNGTGNGDNVIDLSDYETNNMTKVLAAAAEKLSQQNNSMFDITADGDGQTIYLTEKMGTVDYGKDWDLKGTDNNTNNTDGKWGTPVAGGNQKHGVVTYAAGNGKGLTLQIGDTAESYNQLKVSIKDCHADAMGIGNITIADQDSAAQAMGAIKNAINYVSDIRGTLGATQNRLDHTINNLGVMQENIQDAESTIRDVDVAKEMMEYTKNNILVQSAQAMLAQANQLPQGVLQLLG